MVTAFSASKFAAQLFPLNTISPTSQNNPLMIPTTTSPFLGPTRKLIRLSSSSDLNLCCRYGTVVAIFDVVKEKKSKSTPSLLIKKEEGLELCEDMVLERVFEDMCAQMYYRGKMFGFVHFYNGQEAVSTGFSKLLKQQDSVVSTYRDHVHALNKGVSARAVMSELFGKTTDSCRGQGGSMHMFSREHNVLGGSLLLVKGSLLPLVRLLPLSIRGRFLKKRIAIKSLWPFSGMGLVTIDSSLSV